MQIIEPGAQIPIFLGCHINLAPKFIQTLDARWIGGIIEATHRRFSLKLTLHSQCAAITSLTHTLHRIRPQRAFVAVAHRRLYGTDADIV